jgi:SSS family solute:Na+ symporter
VLITLVSAAVMVAVSYATRVPDYPRINGLTFETASDADRALTRASWGKREVFASVFILACILGAYIYFSG